jgi:Zn-dependent protease with chaperone function
LREHQGRFGDGKSAKRYDALVSFAADGLAIRFRDRPTVNWPYATLATANTLSSTAQEVLVTTTAAPGETLFVPSAAFATELRQRAPHLTTVRSTVRMAKPGLIFAGVVAAIIASIYIFDISPAKAVAQILPDAATRRLGDQVLDDLARGRQRCVEPQGVAALDAMVKRLQPDRPATAAPVMVLDWSLVNALALPGGTLILTRGILNQASSPDEIAGVLGHEIGHGIELHPETGLVRALGFYAILQFVTTGQPGALGQAGVAIAALSYGRNAEREADGHALAMLRRAEIPHRPFAGFFRKIAAPSRPGNEKKGPSFTLPDVLSTHPAPEERIKRIEDITDYPSRPSLTAEQWAALRNICTQVQPVRGGAVTTRQPGAEAPKSAPTPGQSPPSGSPASKQGPLPDSSTTGPVNR